MDHVHPRQNIPGVFMTHDFGGRRPPRGIRRYNRRVIAQFRRNFVEPKSVKKEAEVYTPPPPATSSSGFGSGYSGFGGSCRSAAPTPSYPVAYQYEVDTKAKNSRGDCPGCGQFGGHGLKKFRLGGTADTIVELRECAGCGTKFSDFPTPVTAPNGVAFESLPASKHLTYHDCPAEECGEMNVDTYVLVGNSGAPQVKACKCPRCLTLFKPAASPGSTPPSRLFS